MAGNLALFVCLLTFCAGFEIPLGNTLNCRWRGKGKEASTSTPTRTHTSASTPTGTQTSASAPTDTQTSAFTPTRIQNSASTPTGTRETNEDTTPCQVLVYIFGVVKDLLHESKDIADLFKETSIQIFQCIVIVLILRKRLRHYLHQENEQQPNRRPDLQQNAQPNRRNDPQQNPQQPLRRSARRRSTPKKLNL